MTNLGPAAADEVRAVLDGYMAGLGGPAQDDVDALRGLLDLMADFSSNDQRARYLLSSNWLRDYRAGSR